MTRTFIFLCGLLVFNAQAYTGKKRVPTRAVDTFLTDGILIPDRENAMHVVGKRWGITFYRVAGCSVDSVLQDSIDRYNSRSDSIVALRFGKGWDNAFYKGIEKEYETQRMVRSIIFNSDFVKLKVAELDKEGKGLHAYLEPANSPFAYKASLSGWRTINGKDEWVSYYRLEVNYITKEVRIINSAIIKE